MNLKDIGLGYLGDNYHRGLDIHYSSLVDLLKGVNKEIYSFDGSAINEQMMNNFLRKKRSLIEKGKYILEKIVGRNDQGYQERMRQYFNAHKIDCILAYWGLNPAVDIIALKKYRPQTKIILNVLCHPMGISALKIAIQNQYFGYVARFLDGLIYPSARMKDYFEKHVLRVPVPYIIMPPLVSAGFAAESHLPNCQYRPNLVFLGRMDWWEGQITDNVHSQINELLEQKIHVYHSDKTGTVMLSPYRHVFKPMTMHELKRFVPQFDASLLCYNLDVCGRDDRFRNTIPDRLVTSVINAIPIALPARSYDACREYLKDYEAVIEFESPADLKAKLSDLHYMDGLKILARKNSRKYLGEFQMMRLMEFIGFVVSRGSQKRSVQ